MGGGGVVPVRGAVADVAVQDEKGGAALRLPEDLQGVLDAAHVVGVADPQDVPAVAEEAGGHVFREGDARGALDGDVVVVVDPAEVVQAQVARQGGGLGRDPLHQAAVAAHGIDVVVEDVEARPVVVLREPLLRDRHAHARRDPLSQRPGGRLDARYPVVLRVPRRLAVEMAEAADVVEGDRWPPQPFVVRVHRLGPGEVEHGPKQHGGVPVGEHEAVAVGPDWVLGIEAQDAIPDRINQRRQRHRRAGVSGVGLLHRVDRQRADGVDRQLIQLLVGHGLSLSVRFQAGRRCTVGQQPVPAPGELARRESRHRQRGAHGGRPSEPRSPARGCGLV